MPPTPRRLGTTMVISPSGSRRYTPPPSTSLKYRFPSPSTVGPSISPYPEASVSTIPRTLARVARMGPLSDVRVIEIAGIGPDACLARNPKLVYGRMTGWGQEGPYAQAAGHDINYIALAGALAHFGRAGGKPTPPMNIVGDFGGGGMLLAFGVVCAVLDARSSGEGQVGDAAMVDGSAIPMAMPWGLRGLGAFDEEHLGGNVLDTGAPFYDTYETADRQVISP